MRKFCKILDSVNGFIYSCVYFYRRLDTIKHFKERIKNEKETQGKLISRMREQADVMVTLRYALWDIGDILSTVGKSKRITVAKYPTDELKLPLLNFDTFAMRANPPELYEEDCKDKYFCLCVPKIESFYFSGQTFRKCTE